MLIQEQAKSLIAQLKSNYLCDGMLQKKIKKEGKTVFGNSNKRNKCNVINTTSYLTLFS